MVRWDLDRDSCCRRLIRLGWSLWLWLSQAAYHQLPCRSGTLLRVQSGGVMTACAVEVVMMFDEWLGELITDFPADVDGVNDVKLVKGLEDAVNAGAVSVRAALGDFGDGQWHIDGFECRKDFAA